MDPKLIVFIVILVLAGFFVFKKKSSMGPASSTATAEKKPEIKTEPTILNGSGLTQNSAAFANEMLAARRGVAVKSAIGLKSAQLKTAGGKVLIPFDFIPHKLWCQGGDIDTMKYASSSRTEKEFLISLESMDGKQVNEGVHVSLNDLYKGISHVFKVSASTSTKSLALRICADKKKRGTCSSAKVIDQTTLNENMGATGEKPKEDYVFYFQHMILAKDKIQTYRSDVFTDNFKKSVTQFMTQEKVDSKDLQWAFRTTKIIRSNPPDIMDGKIRLTLPYNDPRCMAGR